MAYTVPRPRGCAPRAQGLYKPYSTDCHAISITYFMLHVRVRVQVGIGRQKNKVPRLTNCPTTSKPIHPSLVPRLSTFFVVTCEAGKAREIKSHTTFCVYELHTQHLHAYCTCISHMTFIPGLSHLTCKKESGKLRDEARSTTVQYCNSVNEHVHVRLTCTYMYTCV